MKSFKRCLAIVRNVGFRGTHAEDVAADLQTILSGYNGSHELAIIAKFIRSKVASELDVSVRSLPHKLVELAAINEFEGERARVSREDDDEEDLESSGIPGFDCHSRDFARENKVCPRCSSSKGVFASEYGLCPCGFSYGDMPSHSSQINELVTDKQAHNSLAQAA